MIERRLIASSIAAGLLLAANTGFAAEKHVTAVRLASKAVTGFVSKEVVRRLPRDEALAKMSAVKSKLSAALDNKEVLAVHRAKCKVLLFQFARNLAEWPPLYEGSKDSDFSMGSKQEREFVKLLAEVIDLFFKAVFPEPTLRQRFLFVSQINAIKSLMMKR